ncbi:DNA mismatch repair protein MutS domain protein [Crenothrix polyspora]|uniref:DNA mismatch repair protein MutS domain protein n=1 Tax=Crenothrix polyspora TaxID=360316 RepID=A0A1R4HGU7_9GAMM|nr:DNA mismatch repair protein MutS [Crenothrix polyspora]SJM95466.1 DNA mismatch repair protein MutS domain protein [Crenothrix polyspora]
MKETILQMWVDLPWPAVKSNPFSSKENGVLDESAFNVIEVDKVFDAVNHAATTVGQATLYQSLSHPSADLHEIKAKQQALEELRNNPELKLALEHIVDNACAGEKSLYLLLFGKFIGSFSTARDSDEIEGYGYLQYKRAVAFVLNLVAQTQALPTPQSSYLNEVFNTIKTFTQSRAYSLMEEPVYFTEKGIQTKKDRVGLFPVPVIFRPRIFKPLLLTLIFIVLCVVLYFVAAVIPGSVAFFFPFLLVYFPIVGGYDRDNCIIPLRKEFKHSAELAKTLDALGQLDELLAFMKFADNFGHATVLPTLLDADHHRINLVGAKNPILAKQNSAYVGNDFSLEDEKLVLVTGPNSGGKTAFCKTLTQIQLLAQIGCYIPATSAALTVADKIFYQAPEISHLNDSEGRFGTELKRTKAIFLATTAKSLVVLDELSEGTTFEERMESSSNVLNGFYRKGNSTVLITHNHQLVDDIVKAGIGLAKQVEFANDAPTFHLIPGISRVSHADRVAKKIGFSKEDIDNYLNEAK